MAAEFPSELHPYNIAGSPIGVGWKKWPLIFELYISDIEPDVTHHKKWAIVQWQRMGRQDIPKGWLQLSKRSYKQEAFFELHTDVPYYSTWSTSARRYRTRWRKQLLGRRYTIESVFFDEFKTAYMQSTVAKKIGMSEFAILERKMNDPYTRSFITLFAVRDIRTGTLAAGIATLYSPTYNSSYYQSSFTNQLFSKDRVKLGLMDYCFENAQKKKVRFIALGHVWVKGNARERKGYSDFKKQFGPLHVSFPPLLWRIVRSATDFSKPH